MFAQNRIVVRHHSIGRKLPAEDVEMIEPEIVQDFAQLPLAVGGPKQRQAFHLPQGAVADRIVVVAGVLNPKLFRRLVDGIVGQLVFRNGT